MPRTKGSKNILPGGTASCRQCGKVIEGYTEDWAYRRVMKMAGRPKYQRYTFCSWNCLCAAQREADEYFGVKPDKYEATYQRKLERDRRRIEKKKEKA